MVTTRQCLKGAVVGMSRVYVPDFRLVQANLGDAVTGSDPTSQRPALRRQSHRFAYKRRNLVERMFCRFKDWRRIHTRYDRRADNFLAAIALVVTVTFWC